ncbi:MAG: hypothetical protein IT427_15865 [Pirellulales bacterium]|nr:hypothetical protein [Pirellulales bacterium]
MKRVVLFGLVIALFSMVGVPSAQAQFGDGGFGGIGALGINFPYGLYGNRVNQVPYYAMFPPVYYSRPVPRSYGWSPFAYPPGITTPEVEVVEAQEIINPFVPEKRLDPPNSDAKPSSAKRDKVASLRGPVPQIVINPYVKQMNLASAASRTR